MTDDAQRVPPRPWRVRVADADYGGECWGIDDANGVPVVVTDCGHYPPNEATARFIVRAVNEAKP